MQLTTFTDYGLRSLMYLAAHAGEQCSVREIAAYYGISRNHLVKVVHRLAQLNLIESSKGKGGGICLARDAHSLKLGDLVVLLEPHMYIAECFNRKEDACLITKFCRLKHHLYEAQASFISTLNKYTLADTLSDLFREPT